MQTCPSCGAEQASDARFCSNCGTALQPLAEQQERRIGTVLFSDLAGSTALGEQLDPEDIRRVRAELFELLNAEVMRFGGTTEKLVGDAVPAVFGIPSAHEDPSAPCGRRSPRTSDSPPCRAGREPVRRPRRPAHRDQHGECRSSRETAARGELMVSGDAVNVAARLQQAARPGEILVGARTQAATSRAVVYGPKRELDAKGKSLPSPHGRHYGGRRAGGPRGGVLGAPRPRNFCGPSTA